MPRKKRKADSKSRKAAIFETNTSPPYSEARDLLEEVVELEQGRPELIEAVALFLTDFTGLVLGCIEAKFCKRIWV